MVINNHSINLISKSQINLEKNSSYFYSIYSIYSILFIIIYLYIFLFIYYIYYLYLLFINKMKRIFNINIFKYIQILNSIHFLILDSYYYFTI